MKRIFFPSISVSVLVLLCLPFFCSKGDLDKRNIAAIIGEDTITLAQVDSAYIRLVQEQSLRSPFWKVPEPKRLLTFRKAALNRLISRRIVVQEARKRGILIDSARVSHTFDSLALHQFKGDENRLHLYLDQKKMSMDDFRENIEHKLVFEALMDSMVKPVATPEESLRALYDQNIKAFVNRYREVSHICLYKKLSYVDKPKKMLKRVEDILVAQDSTLQGEALEKAKQKVIEEKKRKAHELLRRLQAGEDFKKLARTYSEDTTNAYRGGYVRKIPYGYRYAPYSDSAFALKKGRISGVTETPYGFFIIRAESNPETTVTPYEQARKKLKKKLDDPKREREFRTLLRQQKAIIYMDTLTPPAHIKF